MNEQTLTNDEKRCLKMWFRQAIVQLEMKEARERLEKWHAGEPSKTTHHTAVGVRRSRRVSPSHQKELV